MVNYPELRLAFFREKDESDAVFPTSSVEARPPPSDLLAPYPKHWRRARAGISWTSKTVQFFLVRVRSKEGWPLRALPLTSRRRLPRPRRGTRHCSRQAMSQKRIRAEAEEQGGRCSHMKQLLSLSPPFLATTSRLIEEGRKEGDIVSPVLDFIDISLFSQVAAPIQINLDDLDALIADLSPEEVEELSRVDPDVSDD